MTDRTYSARPHCVECAYGGGIAILDTQTNAYFSMNDVGRFVWQQIQSPTTPSDVIHRVSTEFGVEASVCRPDIEKLLADLAANDLAQVS